MTVKFSYPIIPLGINPSIGIGSTRGPCVDPIPILRAENNGRSPDNVRPD